MFTQISKPLGVALLLAMLAGCGSGSNSPAQNQGDIADKGAADGKVECALASAVRFERVCSTEQISANGVIMLIIRHPDGGFRRFNILSDGRGLEPADGFDETRIRVLENSMIELTSGDDKYRLPAQIESSVQTTGNDPAKDAG